MAPKKKGLPTNKQDSFVSTGADEDALLTSSSVLDEETSSGIQRAEEKTEDELARDAEQDLNEEIDANFNFAYDAAREFIEEAKEDIEFKTGSGQWTQEERATLENQGRPCMTFNKIGGLIDLLAGHFIQNTNRIEVAPDGGEDEQFSDISDKIIDHLDEQAALEFNLGYMFPGGQTTGRVYLELLLDFENDPIFGELQSIYHGRPGIIFPDPRGTDYDLNKDRAFLFKLVKKSKSELKSLYPDKKEVIEEIASDSEAPAEASSSVEGGANNYGNDKGKSKTGINSSPMGSDESQNAAVKRFHVKEYWRFKYVDRWFVYFADKGDIPYFESEEKAQAEIAKRKAAFLASGGLEQDWKFVMKKRKKREMWVAVRCGGKILTDGKSPFEPYYNGYPFFQFIAKWTPEAEKDVDAHQGIVRGLKDPQREKNKARSQFLHIINTAANSGWIIDEDAMEPARIDELKTFGSVPGIVIKKKSGKEVTRIEPVAAPMAQSIREKAADDDFKEVSLINSDLLAVDENTNPSGKALAIRIRQGLTVLEPSFRNFRRTKKLIGTAMMKMTPAMFDVSKLKKVLGVKFIQTNEIEDAELKAFLIQIEDLKYLVRVAEQGDTKTLREETFENLMQMQQHGMALPFEVLLDFMSVPNKQELLKKVQEFQAKQQANALAVAQAGGKAPAGAGASAV